VQELSSTRRTSPTRIRATMPRSRGKVWTGMSLSLTLPTHKYLRPTYFYPNTRKMRASIIVHLIACRSSPVMLVNQITLDTTL
jgi:hypothetical protein